MSHISNKKQYQPEQPIQLNIKILISQKKQPDKFHKLTPHKLNIQMNDTGYSVTPSLSHMYHHHQGGRVLTDASKIQKVITQKSNPNQFYQPITKKIPQNSYPHHPPGRPQTSFTNHFNHNKQEIQQRIVVEPRTYNLRPFYESMLGQNNVQYAPIQFTNKQIIKTPGSLPKENNSSVIHINSCQYQQISEPSAIKKSRSAKRVNSNSPSQNPTMKKYQPSNEIEQVSNQSKIPQSQISQNICCSKSSHMTSIAHISQSKESFEEIIKSKKYQYTRKINQEEDQSRLREGSDSLFDKKIHTVSSGEDRSRIRNSSQEGNKSRIRNVSQGGNRSRIRGESFPYKYPSSEKAFVKEKSSQKQRINIHNLVDCPIVAPFQLSTRQDIFSTPVPSQIPNPYMSRTAQMSTSIGEKKRKIPKNSLASPEHFNYNP